MTESAHVEQPHALGSHFRTEDTGMGNGNEIEMQVVIDVIEEEDDDGVVTEI